MPEEIIKLKEDEPVVPQLREYFDNLGGKISVIAADVNGLAGELRAAGHADKADELLAELHGRHSLMIGAGKLERLCELVTG